jgi:hypothetical protein
LMSSPEIKATHHKQKGPEAKAPGPKKFLFAPN